MSQHKWINLGVFAAAALSLLTVAAKTRAADFYAEKQRVANVYEACYGESCHGRNGYQRQFNGCRPCHGTPNDCDRDDCDKDDRDRCEKEDRAWAAYRHCAEHCCCEHCCCHHFMDPGSVPPSRVLDICLYRVIFPISPWYSHPRDGILYPAYGSKSPSCSPITH
jgi:hypothetical protein